MRAITRLFLMIGAMGGAFSVNGQQLQKPIPPYETPAYTKPADDSAAFGSLLEAAGYSKIANAGWVGVAAGAFCGGNERKLAVIANHLSSAGRPPHVRNSPTFSLLQGPTPFFIGEIGGFRESDSDPAATWRAVAAGKLDSNDRHDQVIAVRHTTRNVPDLFVIKISSVGGSSTPSQCGDSSVIASATIGDPSNSDWLGVAVGDFDGTGKKRIVLLRAQRPNLFLIDVDLNQGTLSAVLRQDLGPSQWKGLAAGDIDGSGKDALILAREVSDGQSDTVLAYKLNKLPSGGSIFRPFAASTFGNDGNSNWSALTGGDFNADGRQAIVLVKNQHPNFVLLDLAPGTAQPPNLQPLRTLSVADLDSMQGQYWTGLAATDWLRGDQGAAELIAVRAVTGAYRTNVFVYGNPFHRISRDTGLAGTKAQWAKNFAMIEDLEEWLRGSHTNTFYWHLSGPGDFTNLVRFLDDTKTKHWSVDGRQLRVLVTLVPPNAVPNNGCSQPEDTSITSPPLTSWNPMDFFGLPPHPSDSQLIEACKSMTAWASVIGRLAQDFPHLVGLGIDDFSDFLYEPFTPESIAELESNMRIRSPWLNFVPFVYHPHPSNGFPQWTDQWADLGLTLDSMIFFFRNDKRDPKHRHCVNNTLECELTVNNAPDEIADMSQLLPRGRKLLLGIYFHGLWSGSDGTPPRIRYDYDLARLALNMPAVGGAMAYGLQVPSWVCSNLNPQSGCLSWTPCTGTQCAANCIDTNFLESNFPESVTPFEFWGEDRYCALWKAYSEPPQRIVHIDRTEQVCLSQLSCPPAAAGNPFGYVLPRIPERTPAAPLFPTVHNVVFRATDGHVHRLWRLPRLSGDDDLSGGAQAPEAASDPKAYVFEAQGLQNVVYRGTDNHVHRLFWAIDPPAVHEDLTARARALDPTHVPPAIGNPSGYVIPFQGVQNVLYRGNDGSLHGLWWSGVAADDVHNDLLARSSVSDSVGYVAITQRQQNAIYIASGGRQRQLYRAFWTVGGATYENLTRASHTPTPVGLPIGNFNEIDGLHHVFFRSLGAIPRYSADGGRVYVLWGNTTPTNSGEVSGDVANAPVAQSNISAYFVPATRTNHVFYTYLGDVHEVWWQEEAVGANHNILTALAGAPIATSDPSAYFDPTDDTHHVIYRSSDGHLHELQWSH